MYSFFQPHGCGSSKKKKETHMEPKVIFKSSKREPQQTSPLLTSKQMKAFHGHSVMIPCHSVLVWGTAGNFFACRSSLCATNNLNVSALDDHSYLLTFFCFFVGMRCIQSSQKGLFHVARFPKEGKATKVPWFMIQFSFSQTFSGQLCPLLTWAGHSLNSSPKGGLGAKSH